MKKFLSVALLACVLSAPAFAEKEKPEPPVRYYVVRHTDIDRTERAEIMTGEDVKTLTDEIRAESMLFQKAVDGVRTAWNRDADLKRTSFPKNALTARKMEPPGMAYEDVTKAEKKLKNITAASDAAAQKRAAKAKPASEEKTKEGELGKKAAIDKAVEMVRIEMDKLKEAAATKAAAAGGGVAEL